MVTWIEKKDVLDRVKEKISPADIVLDIGCGIRPQRLVKPVIHICLEPFEQYIEALRSKISSSPKRYYIFVKAAWAEAVKLFPERSVDSIFLIDVIEHLEKEEGKRLLKETEKIARKQVVLFTPLGFLPQSHPDGKDAWGLDGGDWQEHKSGWVPEDFDSSYEVIACKSFHSREGKVYGALWAIRNPAC